MRNKKDKLPELPEWVTIVQLSEQFNKLPSEILEEPLEWIVKLTEYYYHKNREPKKVKRSQAYDK